jgi:hypothetical protein
VVDPGLPVDPGDHHAPDPPRSPDKRNDGCVLLLARLPWPLWFAAAWYDLTGIVAANCASVPPRHPTSCPDIRAAIYPNRNVGFNGISIGIVGITNVCGFALNVDLSDHCFCWDYIDNRDIELYRQCVPPVGVEPTLRTLLGGRPLPLGYGGGTIILRAQLPN